MVMVATWGSCRARVVCMGGFNMSRGLMDSVDCVCLTTVRMSGRRMDVTLEMKVSGLNSHAEGGVRTTGSTRS